MTKKTKFKPTFPQLALMDWVLEKGHKRFFTHSSSLNSGNQTWLYEAGPEGEDGKRKLFRAYPGQSRENDVALLERLGGRDSISTHQLYQQGYVMHISPAMQHEKFNKFISQFSERGWHWAEQVYLVTSAGRAWWEEEGRDLHAKAVAERAAARAETLRLVVIGRESRIQPELSRDLRARVPEGIPLPIPSRKAMRPQATAIVTKETETRFYVEDVKPLRSRSISERSVVEGREPNEYVSRENVLVDHATPEIARRLAEIDAEYVEDVNRIAEQTIEALLPSLQDLASRLAQKDAEREDMVRELLSGQPDASPKP